MSKQAYATVACLDRAKAAGPSGRRPVAPPDDMEAIAAVKFLVRRHGVDFVVRAAKLLEK